MNKFQINQKINIIRKQIREIYGYRLPFIQSSVVKLEKEIQYLIIGYITDHFNNTIIDINKDDIDDLIGFYCEKKDLKCNNFSKTDELIEFEIFCFAQPNNCINFENEEFGDILNTFEFSEMDMEYLQSYDEKNKIIEYKFKISDNWELIFNK